MVRKTIGFRKLAILPCSVQSQVDRVSQLLSSNLVKIIEGITDHAKVSFVHITLILS